MSKKEKYNEKTAENIEKKQKMKIYTIWQIRSKNALFILFFIIDGQKTISKNKEKFDLEEASQFKSGQPQICTAPAVSCPGNGRTQGQLDRGRDERTDEGNAGLI